MEHVSLQDKAPLLHYSATMNQMRNDKYFSFSLPCLFIQRDMVRDTKELKTKEEKDTYFSGGRYSSGAT